MMSFEDFIVFFVVCKFFVERPKVFLGAYHVVAGPLVRNEEEGCAAKVILCLLVGGGALANLQGGRATQKKKQVYDCTLGYPGEDGATQSSYQSAPKPIS